MTSNTDSDKYNTCLKLLDEGKYVEAIKLAEILSNDAFRAGVLIDGGLEWT